MVNGFWVKFSIPVSVNNVCTALEAMMSLKYIFQLTFVQHLCNQTNCVILSPSWFYLICSIYNTYNINLADQVT